jgi:hypothetical protein
MICWKKTSIIQCILYHLSNSLFRKAEKQLKHLSFNQNARMDFNLGYTTSKKKTAFQNLCLWMRWHSIGNFFVFCFLYIAEGANVTNDYFRSNNCFILNKQKFRPVSYFFANFILNRCCFLNAIS